MRRLFFLLAVALLWACGRGHVDDGVEPDRAKTEITKRDIPKADLFKLLDHFNEQVKSELHAEEATNRPKIASSGESPVPSSESYPPSVRMKSCEQFQQFLSNEKNYIFGHNIKFENPWGDVDLDPETLNLLSLIAKDFDKILEVTKIQLRNNFEYLDQPLQESLRSPWIGLDEEDPLKWSINGGLNGITDDFGWTLDFKGSEFVEYWAGS